MPKNMLKYRATSSTLLSRSTAPLLDARTSKAIEFGILYELCSTSWGRRPWTARVHRKRKICNGKCSWRPSEGDLNNSRSDDGAEGKNVRQGKQEEEKLKPLQEQEGRIYRGEAAIQEPPTGRVIGRGDVMITTVPEEWKRAAPQQI